MIKTIKELLDLTFGNFSEEVCPVCFEQLPAETKQTMINGPRMLAKVKCEQHRLVDIAAFNKTYMEKNKKESEDAKDSFYMNLLPKPKTKTKQVEDAVDAAWERFVP